MNKPVYDYYVWGGFEELCAKLEINIEKEEYMNATTDALGRNQLCDVPLLWETYRAGFYYPTIKERLK